MITAPHSLEAERAVIGGVLMRPSVFDEASAELDSGDFYPASHRAIWDALGKLRQAGRPIDALTLSDQIRAQGCTGLLEGGEGYLLTLVGSIPTTEHTRTYVRMVKDKATLRRLLDHAASLQHQALLPDANPSELLSDARRALSDLDTGVDSGPVRVGDALPGVFDEIGAKASGESKRGMVKTGIGSYDRLIGAFQPGQLVIVAGRPGMGKTALAGSIAVKVALGGTPVLVFSLEMTLQEMSERAIGMVSRFNVERLHRGDVQLEDVRRLYSNTRRLVDAPLWVDDRVLTAWQIAGVARSWRARQPRGAALVVIDYLGLIRPSGKQESRTLEVGQMAWAAKVLAKEIDCPVVLLSQLNRKSEQERRRPVMSDLRDSGEIEQHAHLVIFPHREPPLENSGPATLIVAKNRGGRTGDVPCYWRSELMLYEDAANEPQGAIPQQEMVDL